MAFFTAEDPEHGRELWRTDGTAAGTVLLEDIWPGPDWGMQNNELRFTAVMGDVLFFPATDGKSGQELWRSDGTAEGTYRVKDIWAGPDWGLADLEHSAVVGDTLYFAAQTGKADASCGRPTAVRPARSACATSTPTAHYSDPALVQGFRRRPLLRGRRRPARPRAVEERWYGRGDGAREGHQSSRQWAAGLLLRQDRAARSQSSPNRTADCSSRLTTGSMAWSFGPPMAQRSALAWSRTSHRPDYGWSDPWFLQALGDQLLFFAAKMASTAASSGASDGTERGTQLVRDINPSSVGLIRGKWLRSAVICTFQPTTANWAASSGERRHR